MACEVEDSSLGALFPSATSLFEFAASSGYQAAASLEAGKGYWINMPAPATVVVSGVPLSSCAVNSPAGWSMIGPCSMATSVADLGAATGAKLISVFSFDSGYRTASMLEPGRGYWINMSSAGVLNFGEERVLDCNGVWGGDALADNCGVCDNDPFNDCVRDCSGEWGGTYWMSDCGCVAADNSGDDCDDCKGVPNGDALLDECNGIPDNGGDSGEDCEGVDKGSALVDECGVCSGGTTGHVANSDKDCDGVCHGSSSTDMCGVCDSDASTDCSFTYAPADEALSVPWDPEIGIRIRLNDPSLSPSEAHLSNIAEVLTLTDMNGARVAGETKLFPLAEERELLVSFVPTKVLYGNHTYQVTIDAEAVLDVGGVPVNFSQALDSFGLLDSGTYSWTFTTAELTRFALPVLLEYDDTVCHCSGSPDAPKPPGCLASPAPSQFAGQCYTPEHVDEIVFGPENNQISGYWSHMSQGRLVLSKLRSKEGQILGTVHLRRTGINGEGQTTNRDFRNSESEAILAELSAFIDFDRYALLETPEGDLNVLAPYPDRDFVASRVENGYYEHFNVYMMQIYGNPGNFTFGSSSTPSGSNTDIRAFLSHQDYYYSSYKWLHETGHGFFGMNDLYYQSQFPGTGGVFGIMGNHYAHDIPPQTSDAWHTILAEIALTENPYDATDVTDILADATAEASCGTADTPCYLRARYPDGEIWRFPAVIEKGEVVGEYYVEFYGTRGNDGNLEFQGVDHNQHPGVISVWKMDESTQKILDHICYFDGCDVERYRERSSHWERPEYYPSCPNVMPTEWLARTPIYKTFPWWEYERMPYISADPSDQPAAPMPRIIELPVVEVPAYGGTAACAAPLMDAACRFGGGNRVGMITLGFHDTVNALEAAIGSNPLDRDAYLLPAEIPFTLTFEPTADAPMTYADHILPQHRKYISTDTDDYCGQILTDGFFMPEAD